MKVVDSGADSVSVGLDGRGERPAPVPPPPIYLGEERAGGRRAIGGERGANHAGPPALRWGLGEQHHTPRRGGLPRGEGGAPAPAGGEEFVRHESDLRATPVSDSCVCVCVWCVCVCVCPHLCAATARECRVGSAWCLSVDESSRVSVCVVRLPGSVVAATPGAAASGVRCNNQRRLVAGERTRARGTMFCCLCRVCAWSGLGRG
jgi:hypothetical protein